MTECAVPSLTEKARMLERLRATVREDLATLQRAHQVALQGVTHEDARQEGDKDMRATEASYVARGQALRVVELQEALTALEVFELRAFAAADPIALGALVTLEAGDDATAYFLVPAGGGLRLDGEAGSVRTITPRSPLGRALIGHRVAEEVSWQTPHGEVEGVVTAVV